jgi:hypothetical protein
MVVSLSIPTLPGAHLARFPLIQFSRLLVIRLSASFIVSRSRIGSERETINQDANNGRSINNIGPVLWKTMPAHPGFAVIPFVLEMGPQNVQTWFPKKPEYCVP